METPFHLRSLNRDGTTHPGLPPVAKNLLLPFGLYFRFIERSPILVQGCIVIALMLATGAMLNRWIKISGHVAFAAFSAVILGRVGVAYGVVAGLFIPLLGWSRVTLLRHTLSEVLAGLTLGLIAAGFMLWL